MWQVTNPCLPAESCAGRFHCCRSELSFRLRGQAQSCGAMEITSQTCHLLSDRWTLPLGGGGLVLLPGMFQPTQRYPGILVIQLPVCFHTHPTHKDDNLLLTELFRPATTACFFSAVHTSKCLVCPSNTASWEAMLQAVWCRLV